MEVEGGVEGGVERGGSIKGSRVGKRVDASFARCVFSLTLPILSPICHTPLVRTYHRHFSFCHTPLCHTPLFRTYHRHSFALQGSCSVGSRAFQHLTSTLTLSASAARRVRWVGTMATPTLRLRAGKRGACYGRPTAVIATPALGTKPPPPSWMLVSLAEIQNGLEINMHTYMYI